MTILRQIYRHYNLLIDICFWVQFYISAKTALQLLEILPEPLYPANWFGAVLLALQFGLGLCSFFLLTVLLLVRRFRDEYAEKLWQKAAGTFAKALFLLPWIWVLSWSLAKAMFGGIDWMFSLQIPELIHPDTYPVTTESISPGLRQLLALDVILALLWIFAPFTFAAIYKWYRWRDGE